MTFYFSPIASKRAAIFTIAAAALTALCVTGSAQQQNEPGTATPSATLPQSPSNPAEDTPGELYGKLLQLPVSRLVPGDVHPKIDFKSPENDPQAVERGMRYFNAFNCVGCHAANGGGGMGPSLSNHYFKFGSSPGNIYMTIVQGRALGMPAWGNCAAE